MTTSKDWRRDERGSGTFLTMSLMTITAMAAFIGACLMSWFGCVHLTRSAADLAALAGADAFSNGQDACTKAGAAASANGVTMTACQVASNGVDLVVRVTVRMDAKPRVVFGPTQFTHTSEAGYVRS